MRATEAFGPGPAETRPWEILVRDSLAEVPHQLRSVAQRSSFYRDRWATESLRDAADLRTDDVPDFLASLPLTTKDELRQAQQATPPFGNYLACDRAEIAVVHRTSGTTGRPLVIAATNDDLEQTATHGARAFSSAGLGSEDVVVHCLSYCMWAGGYTDHRGLEATGAAVIPFGVGNTHELLDLQSWLPFSAISLTPSYVQLLLEQMSSRQQELWRKNLTLVLVGGEPGGSDPELRRRVRDAFDARLVNANYGMAEVLSNFGSECDADDGLHFHGHGALWLELLGPGLGATVDIRAGSRGTAVLTHQRRRAQPLVRYNTNDIYEVISTDPCACGRTTPRFRVVGRADDMFIVRGVNVFPSAVGEALGSLGVSNPYAIVLPAQETFEVVPLYLEETEATLPSLDSIEAAVRRLTRAAVRIALLPPQSLPRSEGKTKHLFRYETAPSHLRQILHKVGSQIQ